MEAAGVKDKRRHERHAARFPLRYRETVARPAAYHGAQARDVSLGGVRFVTDSFLPVDTSLLLELRLEEKGKPVRAVSRVAWSRSYGSGDRYEVGSSFVEISPSEEHVLWCFLAPWGSRG